MEDVSIQAEPEESKTTKRRPTALAAGHSASRLAPSYHAPSRYRRRGRCGRRNSSAHRLPAHVLLLAAPPRASVWGMPACTRVSACAGCLPGATQGGTCSRFVTPRMRGLTPAQLLGRLSHSFVLTHSGRIGFSCSAGMMATPAMMASRSPTNSPRPGENGREPRRYAARHGCSGLCQLSARVGAYSSTISAQ